MSSNLENSFSMEDENGDIVDDDVKVAPNTFIPCQQLPELTASIGPGLLKIGLLPEVQRHHVLFHKSVFYTLSYLVSDMSMATLLVLAKYKLNIFCFLFCKNVNLLFQIMHLQNTQWKLLPVQLSCKKCM